MKIHPVGEKFSYFENFLEIFKNKKEIPPNLFPENSNQPI
jgi:hypothetical protein